MPNKNPKPDECSGRNCYGCVRDLLVLVVVLVVVYLSTQFSVWRALNATITSLVYL